MKKTLLITQCKDPHRWYADMIGKEVPYLGDTGTEYKSKEPAGYTNFVQYEDSAILESPLTINDVAAEIMDLIPTEQLRVDATAHLRTKIHLIILNHSANRTQKLLDQINEYSRKLYIAEKKIEDNAVDSSGFNK